MYIIIHIFILSYIFYRFVVNIKLGGGKLVPIIVYDDIPAQELAISFGKIHSLDMKAVNILTSVLQQHLDARKPLKN